MIVYLGSGANSHETPICVKFSRRPKTLSWSRYHCPRAVVSSDSLRALGVSCPTSSWFQIVHSSLSEYSLWSSHTILVPLLTHHRPSHPCPCCSLCLSTCPSFSHAWRLLLLQPRLKRHLPSEASLITRPKADPPSLPVHGTYHGYNSLVITVEHLLFQVSLPHEGRNLVCLAYIVPRVLAKHSGCAFR